MHNDKRCLLMFSGGRDSWLACARLIEEGYQVSLVHYDNGKSVGAENLELAAERLRQMYGSRVEFLGTRLIAGIWREFFLPYMTMTPSEVRTEWGELPFSQFCCLSCRTAMYVWSIQYSRANGIECIAEGARESQNWPIMQKSMIERFRSLVEEHGLKLLTPVFDIATNWQRKNALLRRNFVPKVLEPQCLLGVALPDAKRPPKEVQQAVEKFYDSVLLPYARNLIKEGNPALHVERVEQHALL